MSYNRFMIIDLGIEYSGNLNIRAQLRDISGTAIGSEIVVDSERPGGGGIYTITIPNIPNDHIGYVDFYITESPSVIIFTIGIEPVINNVVTSILEELVSNHNYIEGSVAEALSYLDYNISDVSKFDPILDKVNIGKVNGEVVNGKSDLKARNRKVGRIMGMPG